MQQSCSPYSREGNRGGILILLLVLIVVVVFVLMGLDGCACSAEDDKKPVAGGSDGPRPEEAVDEVFGGLESRQRDVAALSHALDQAIANSNPVSQPYDIEKTMQLVRGLDHAIYEARSISAYLDIIRAQDFRNVAPKALHARKEIVDVLMRFYVATKSKEASETCWQAYADIMGTYRPRRMGIDSPAVGFEVQFDEERMRGDEKRRQDRYSQQQHLRELVSALEVELVQAIEGASPTFKDLGDEWKRLCLLRDRAYIEAVSLRFDSALVFAKAATELAPFDMESKLLQALALVEGHETNPETSINVETLLDDVLNEYPDCAPALLLKGRWMVRSGQEREARVELRLASTRYPEQAKALSSRLDPYKMRSYLQRSREGVGISGLYKAMMLGASLFSPELQEARLELESGNQQRANELVRDHFSRRQAQAQWDLVLYDLRFCEEFLGDHYNSVFPEKSYIDLDVESTLFGKDFAVSITNRSDRTLHNAALVLCVRFTDMQPHDYLTIAAGPTRPVIPALNSTSFEDLDIRMPWGDLEKGPADIIPPIRAILVADEAVFWVDQVSFKYDAFGLGAAPTDVGQTTTLPPVRPERWERAISSLREGEVNVTLIKNTFSKDDICIELPREVAQLGPMFSLRIGSRTFDEGPNGKVDNRLKAGRVRVLFAGAGPELAAEPDQLRLVAHCKLGNIHVAIVRSPDGIYRVANVE